MNARHLCVFLLVYSWLCACSGEQAVDGFYDLVPQSETVVLTESGREIGYGKKLDLEVVKASIRSLNNENSSFYCRLQLANKEKMVVYIHDNVGYPYFGSGKNLEATDDIGFQFSGFENAEDFSQKWPTSLQLRKHPGYQLLTTFRSTADSYSLGEPVEVTVTIKNLGDQTVHFTKGGRYRGFRDNQYAFQAFYRGKPVEDIGRFGDMGGLASAVALEPGKTFEDTISLDKWFKFDEPGIYNLYGSYFLEFVTSDMNNTLWVDYVTDEFTIHILESPLKPLN